MADIMTVEQRVAALEMELAQLKKRLDELTAPKGNWIDQISGSMKDQPGFEEMIRLGAEWRQAQKDPY